MGTIQYHISNGQRQCYYIYIYICITCHDILVTNLKIALTLHKHNQGFQKAGVGRKYQGTIRVILIIFKCGRSMWFWGMRTKHRH